MSDCRKCTLPPSAPPAATPPTQATPPEPWNELAAFRETALRHFTRAEDRASLARLGELLTESALEQAHLWPPLAGAETTNGARAAYRDLLHTLTFLRHLGEARHQSTLPQPEAVLAAIAARTVRRLLPEVERLREAIERCEAAEGRVH
jgi:hypothetical protein